MMQDSRAVAIVTGGCASRGIGRACLPDSGGTRICRCCRFCAGDVRAAGDLCRDHRIRRPGRLLFRAMSLSRRMSSGIFAAADMLGRLAVLVDNAGVVDLPCARRCHER